MSEESWAYLDRWSDTAIEQEILRIEGQASYQQTPASKRKLRELKRKRKKRIMANEWTGGIGADS